MFFVRQCVLGPLWVGSEKFVVRCFKTGCCEELQGIGVQIMAMSPSQLEEKPTNPDTKETWQYPPTYFMHMPRDTRTAEYVAKDIAVLQKLVPP